jgi:hypothetical protein
MGRKCKHHVFARRWVHGEWIVLLGDSRDADGRRCSYCHEWLPLGPSNDSGEFAEAVACEVRAAEIAATMNSGNSHDNSQFISLTSFAERRGWAGHKAEEFASVEWAANPDRAGLAGYLARAITTHTEQSEGSNDR